MKIKNCLKEIDFVYLLTIILAIIGISFFIKHIFWIYYDIGREFYFPQLILQNKILYRDIFNLFGPFSYLFNMLIYKFFGTDLSVLYSLGYITGIITISGIYFLAKELTDRITSFVISLFAISTGITTVLNFNYTLPYSYAVLYGFILFLFSLYFFVKSQKLNKNYYLYISVFFSGVAACSKYEFVLYSLFLLFFIFRYKLVNKKSLIPSLALFLLPLLICFSFLFLKGLSFNNCIHALDNIKSLIQSESCKYLYTQMGTYFSFNNMFLSVKSFIITGGLVFSFYIGLYSKKFNTVLSYTILLVSLILTFLVMNMIPYNELFCFIPIAVLTTFIFSFKLFNQIEKFVIISAILESFKVFWCCSVKYYGVFFAPVLIIAACIIAAKHKNLLKSVNIYLILFSVAVIFLNIENLHISNFPIKINSNKMYTFIDAGYKTNELIKYINKETKPSDKIIVYPEGLIINYITERPSENIYYALNPAFLEVFGEKNVIKYYKDSKPKYFVLMRDSTMEMYGYKYICEDYAKDFCNFINENYTLEKTLIYMDSDTEPFYIYKLRE